MLAVAACRSSAPDAAPPDDAFRVLRVVDGDTVVIESAGHEEKVRLLEVNAPESAECGGDAATELLRRLSKDGVILDRRGEDRYGRTLAHLHTRSGEHVQRELVSAGLAHVATYDHPDEHLEELLAAESVARNAHRGIYGSALVCAARATPSMSNRVAIVQVDANPAGDDLLEGAGESVLLEGDPGLSLAGWTLKDTSASHRLVFANRTILAPDGRLRVFTSCGTPRSGAVHWCVKGSAVWNNSGDSAYLLDPSGRVISWLDYEPPVPRRGAPDAGAGPTRPTRGR